jgi:hypothetical protein
MRKHKGHTRLRQRAGPANLTRMRAQKHWFILVCALLLACGSESSPPAKTPSTFTVFPNLPLPPGARFVSRAGSADALQITFFSPSEAPAVTEYYRGVLSKGKWRLVSETKKPDGTVVLYAEKDGPPIWVSLWPTSDKAGTMVQLAGAVVPKDTTKSAQPSTTKSAPKPKS